MAYRPSRIHSIEKRPGHRRHRPAKRPNTPALSPQVLKGPSMIRLRINGELKLVRWMVGLSLALSTGTIALLAKLFFALPH